MKGSAENILTSHLPLARKKTPNKYKNVLMCPINVSAGTNWIIEVVFNDMKTNRLQLLSLRTFAYLLNCC